MAVGQLQHALAMVKEWLESVKLRVNASKTILMIFSKRKQTLPELSLKIDGFEVVPSPSTKILGVIIDSQLKWREHLMEKEIKFKRLLHSIKRHLGRSWGLSSHRLKTLYKAIAEPTLLYACSVWASVINTKRGVKKLRSIERGFNLLITRSFKSADAGALSVLAGSVPLDYRIRELVLRRYYFGGFKSFSSSALRTVEGLIPSFRFGRLDSSSSEIGATPPWLGPAQTSQMAVSSSSSSSSLSARNVISLALPDVLVGGTPFRSGQSLSCPRMKAIRIIQGVLFSGWEDEWEAAKQGAATRSLFPGPDCVRKCRGLRLTFQLTQFYTGHSFLNEHQHRVGRLSSPLCSCGSGVIESRDHFLFDCRLFGSFRGEFVATSRRELGIWPPHLSSIHTSAPTFHAMMRFIAATGRLKYPGTVGS